MAIEEPDFRLIREDGDIQVRDYDAVIVAETVVEADFENAGNEAFRSLFDYISENDIAMTAPVTQESTGEGWAVRFVMPEAYSLESLPEPQASNVQMKALPPRRMAVIVYSGSWSGENYRSHLAELMNWLNAEGFEVTGDAIWARYNGPFSLWFLRRNEIHLPIRLN